MSHLSSDNHVSLQEVRAAIEQLNELIRNTRTMASLPQDSQQQQGHQNEPPSDPTDDNVSYRAGMYKSMFDNLSDPNIECENASISESDCTRNHHEVYRRDMKRVLQEVRKYNNQRDVWMMNNIEEMMFTVGFMIAVMGILIIFVVYQLVQRTLRTLSLVNQNRSYGLRIATPEERVMLQAVLRHASLNSNSSSNNINNNNNNNSHPVPVQMSA